MKFKFPCACVMILALQLSCSNQSTPANASAEFRITIQEYYLAEGGYRLDYEIVPSAVRVKYADDFNSDESVLIWESNLVSEQRAELAAAVAKLKLDKLAGSYDPGSVDGVRINFEFVIGQSKPKKVHIGNTNQPDLQEFVQRVNRFIQNAEYRIREKWEDDGTAVDDEAMPDDSSTTQESDVDTDS